MANCCLFLANESSIVNGATLVADGGAMAVELTSTMVAGDSVAARPRPAFSAGSRWRTRGWTRSSDGERLLARRPGRRKQLPTPRSR
jgi:hypothetical protein